ncbi:MAG: hypothetical protein GY941_21485 [Planctomycetes bacterium]|nr:hypothetical protein [Planctomycetota bacterium]
MIDFRKLYALEVSVIPVINKLERRGLAWDWKLAMRSDRKIRRKMQHLLESETMADVNPNSPKQVKEHFINVLGMPEKLLMKKGKVTTGSKQVEAAVKHLENNDRWQHIGIETVKCVTEFSKCLADFRHLSKVSSTYLRPFSEMADHTDGIIYPSLNPFGAITGRMSGTLQQMHKDKEGTTPEQKVVRQCVVCRNGYEMWYFDFSQMELYIFGAVANEQDVLDAYDDGEDVHQKMADLIGLPRNQTKSITFGLLYGEGIKALADVLGLSMTRAKEVVDLYHETFPGIREFQSELECELQANGFVQDWFGRRYSLRSSEAYKAVNAYIQGCCASIFKTALVQTDGVLQQDEHILLVIHDEIVLERPVGKPGRAGFVERVADAMQDVSQLTDRGLQLRVDVEVARTNWADKKPFEI